MKINRPKLKPLTTATLAGLLSVTVAHAHPGHSFFDATPAHLLTSPNHFGVLAASGVVLFFGARLVKRQLTRRALQGAGIMVLAGALITWGLLA